MCGLVLYKFDFQLATSVLEFFGFWCYELMKDYQFCLFQKFKCFWNLYIRCVVYAFLFIWEILWKMKKKLWNEFKF